MPPKSTSPLIPLLATALLLGTLTVLAFIEAKRTTTLVRFFLFGKGMRRRSFAATLIASNAGLSGAVVLILYYGFMYGLAVFPAVWLFWYLTQRASKWTIQKSEEVIAHQGGWFATLGTMHEFIGAMFESQTARRYAGLLSVLAYVGLVSCELLLAYESVKYFLSSNTAVPGTSLQIYPIAFIITVLLCIVVYCSMAGFRGVIQTDGLQFIVITIKIVVVGVFVLTDTSPIVPGTAARFTSDLLNPDGRGRGYYLSFIISNLFFWGLWCPGAMDQWQRCAAARFDGGAYDRVWADRVWGTVGIVPIIYFGVISLVFVLAGRWLALHMPPNTNITPDLLHNLSGAFDQWSISTLGKVSGGFFGALVPVGLVCAAMSTMDTYVVVATQSLFADVLQPRGAKNIVELSEMDSDGRLLAGARAVTIIVPLLIVATALTIAAISSDVYEFIYFSFSFMFASLPVLYAGLKGWASAAAKKAAEWSLLGGGIACMFGYPVIIALLHRAIADKLQHRTYLIYQLVYWWPVATSVIAGVILWARWPKKGIKT